MKNAILCAAVFVAIVLASSSSAEAGRRYRRFRPIRQNRIFQRSSGPGFFQQLMEIERRKNAWLRARFF